MHSISEPSTENTPAYGTDDASYQAAGEFEGLVKLVDHFYDAMEQLPVAQDIRAMHPEDLTESRDKLACFLSGWLGGPKRYSAKYGSIRIPRAHAHLPIGSAERDAWLACMEDALTHMDYADDFKKYLMEQLFVPAERCRTRD